MIKTDIEYDLIPTFFHRGLVLVFFRMELCPEGVMFEGFIRRELCPGFAPPKNYYVN